MLEVVRDPAAVEALCYQCLLFVVVVSDASVGAFTIHCDSSRQPAGQMCLQRGPVSGQNPSRPHRIRTPPSVFL